MDCLIKPSIRLLGGTQGDDIERLGERLPLAIVIIIAVASFFSIVAIVVGCIVYKKK